MKTVTVKAFVEAVTGKFVSVESTDHYGISLDIPCAKVEYEPEFDELVFKAVDRETGKSRSRTVIRQIKRCRFHQIKTGLSEHLTMG